MPDSATGDAPTAARPLAFLRARGRAGVTRSTSPVRRFAGDVVSTVSPFPAVDDRFAQIEAEGALADRQDRRPLQPFVDRAPHPLEGLVDDGAEGLGRVLVVHRQPLRIG